MYENNYFKCVEALWLKTYPNFITVPCVFEKNCIPCQMLYMSNKIYLINRVIEVSNLCVCVCVRPTITTDMGSEIS